MHNIFIPSFNRVDCAISTVCSLIEGSPNATSYCITVIDNASPEPYLPYFTSHPFLAPFVESKVLSIIRNYGNVGMGANIVKCFEYASNKEGWLWILSDDDEVLPEAILNVQTQLEKQDLLFLSEILELSLFSFS